MKCSKIQIFCSKNQIFSANSIYTGTIHRYMCINGFVYGAMRRNNQLQTPIFDQLIVIHCVGPATARRNLSYRICCRSSLFYFVKCIRCVCVCVWVENVINHSYRSSVMWRQSNWICRNIFVQLSQLFRKWNLSWEKKERFLFKGSIVIFTENAHNILPTMAFDFYTILTINWIISTQKHGTPAVERLAETKTETQSKREKQNRNKNKTKTRSCMELHTNTAIR